MTGFCLTREGDKNYHYGYLDKILKVTENGKQTASFDYHIDGQVAKANYSTGSEDFLWDGLALIHRGGQNYVIEPYATGGNPVIAGDKILMTDLLGNSIIATNGKESTTLSRTAFGESNGNIDEDLNFFTGKPYINELGHAFLFRNYRPNLGKWQTTDPIGYPNGWNNLAYVNNKPMKYIDTLGLAAGDIYSSANAAATAWGKQYNGASISSNKEYGSTIYKNGNGYSYTEPNIGNANSVIPSSDPNVGTVAYIHSHGEYKGEYGVGNDKFSDGDKELAAQYGIDAYVTTPNGSLQMYELSEETVSLVSNDMPYDPNHPTPLKPKTPTTGE